MTSNDEVSLKPTRMRTHPHTTQSRLMLEVASELVNKGDWPYLQAKVSLREQDRIRWAEDALLPFAQMVRDTPEGHLEVPLHPAAERFWEKLGYNKNI